MKKRYLVWLVFPILISLFPMKVYAGDLNGAEQGIISAISSTYAYNGGYYRVKDGYISQVAEYLSQDGVDLSGEAAAGYLSQFYSNIGTGISAGYMECVGTYGDESPDIQTPMAPEESETVPDDEDKENVNGTEKNNDNDNDENNVKDSENISNKDTEENSDKKDRELTGKKTLSKTSVEDKTVGSTTDGVIEYTVIEVDHEKMYVWEIDVLEVHAQAYKDSDIIGTLNKGDEVTVIGASTTGWAQIDYYGETGYVSAIYLRTDGFMTDQGQEVNQSDPKGKEYMIAGQESAAEEFLIETLKDYSDAPPLSKAVRIEWIAAAAVVIILVGSAAIVLSHKFLSHKSKRR